ncbi:MAG: transposase [Actinobacteria bacterium]|nr:transposase [Actinomycetota bacterium]
MARPGTRKIQRYTAEFKLTAVKLTDSEGIQVKDVAEALDIHPFMLSRWRKEVRDGLIKAKVSIDPDISQVDDVRQFAKLKREHALLKEEHELLKKAIRFCSEQRSENMHSSERNRTGSV